jgi:hypothetical protein
VKSASGRVPLLAAALATLALVGPRLARAQDWVQSWTLCTPSAAFHSCHSVSLETDAVLTGDVRTGTTVSITLHNLQGQGYAADNTTSSGLYQAFFLEPGQEVMPSSSDTTTGVGAGGATGTPVWIRESGIYSAATSGAFVDVLANYTSFPTIGGCGTDPLMAPFLYGGSTCAPGSSFTFTFSIDGIFDANLVTAAYILAAGPGTEDYCLSDATQYNISFGTCDVRSETLTQGVAVAPEPVTLTLMATGLFGIGGVGLRRKKRPLG